MAHQAYGSEVVRGAHDRHPQAFCWRGRLYRVLGLRSLYVAGRRRHYRLLTADGCFELVQDGPAGPWQVRRAPGWLERVLAHWQNGPRYPLPAWRRRGAPRAAAPHEVRLAPEPAGRGPTRPAWPDVSFRSA